MNDANILLFIKVHTRKWHLWRPRIEIADGWCSLPPIQSRRRVALYKVAMKIVFGISNVAHSRLKYLVMVFWYSLSAVIDELWPNRELPIEIWSKNVYFHRNRLKSRSKNGNLPRKWVENLKCAEVESSVKVNKKLSSFFLAQSFERKRRRRRQPYIGRPTNSSYGTTIPCRMLVFVPSIRNT